MPSARIKTLAVEDAHSLAEDLRTRGFVVEIVPRDKISADPVDLEVILEECEPEAALHHAENIPDAQDLCVFVAPGALTEGRRSMQVVPLFSEPAAAPLAPVVAMAAATPTHVVEEKLEDTVAMEEPEKLAASELEPPVVVAAKPVDVPKVVPTVSAQVRSVPAKKAPAPAAKPAWWTGAGKSLAAWGRGLAANQRLFRKTATLGGMAAVAAVSVLVLGSTVRKFAPDTRPANESMVSPATASAAIPVVEPEKIKPLAPEPKLAAKAKSRRGRNPEEDIVAKDYVIHFNNRPVAAKAKKPSGVKHYSDLR